MATERNVPYSAFNYLVNLKDGSELDPIGGFSEVNGLNIEATVSEYRRGNAGENYVTKIPGIHKAGDVTLKRGVMGATNLYEWLEEVRRGDIEAKRDIEVKLLAETGDSGSPVVTWTLRGAMPIKWTGPSLNAKGGGDAAIEELVVAVEHCTMA